MVKNKKTFIFCGLLIIFLLILYKLIDAIYISSIKITWRDDLLIGHAFGEVDGDTYTNSKEAFNAAYSRGIRLFEVDFQLTADNKIVLCHDFLDGPETEEQFLNTKIKNKYTPLSLLDLLKIMHEYPDIYIVLDSKYDDEENIKLEFNEMKNVAIENNLLETFNRVIVQVYSEQMYEYVNRIYPFPKYIFTLYKRYEDKISDMKDLEYITSWAHNNNFFAITMWKEWFNNDVNEIMKKYDMKVYVHTVNNVGTAKKSIKNGVYGVYTDSISRNDLK